MHILGLSLIMNVECAKILAIFTWSLTGRLNK